MSDNNSKTIKYGAGQVLCRMGEKTTDLFFITDGTCEIIVRDEETGSDAVVGTAGKGSVVGIMSFLEGDPRSATIKAQSDVECHVIRSTQREKLLETLPTWGKAILKQLASDLKRVDHRYIELNEEHKLLTKKYNVLKSKSDAK